MTWEQQKAAPSDGQVRDTQVDAVAGVWICENCGRRIQVITDSEVPKKQPFVCVCGARMIPGEEHTTPGPEAGGTAIDA
jgi:hypothetical protein